MTMSSTIQQLVSNTTCLAVFQNQVCQAYGSKKCRTQLFCPVLPYNSHGRQMPVILLLHSTEISSRSTSAVSASGRSLEPLSGHAGQSTKNALPRKMKAVAGNSGGMPEMMVPEAWTQPAAAKQEADWLRSNLHQWLDNEYCPEAANEEISARCSRVFYRCLLEGQREVGEILMEMVGDLASFSFKQSFHGQFSSANAAIDLISRRMIEYEYDF
eukprot:jgi/Mesen1/9295/ME000060S08732